MNQALSIAELKTCLNCKFRRPTIAKICPQCRKHRLWTPNGVRIIGILQIVLGMFIAGFALLVIVINDSYGRKYSNERTFLVLSFALVVIGGSFFECLSGGWKLLTGKSNPKLMSAVLTAAFFIMLFITAYVELNGI